MNGALAHSRDNRTSFADDEKAKNSKAFMEGKYKGDDDVGILFQSLRNLVRALDQESELRVMNDNLEKDVRERTEQLAVVGKRLESESTERRIVEGILGNIMPESICCMNLNVFTLILQHVLRVEKSSLQIRLTVPLYFSLTLLG